MVASLLSICVLALAKYPQHAHLLPTPIYLSHISTLKHIITHPADINPNLWLTLIQVFHNLPSYFRTYSLPWHHKQIPLFQSIISTTNFTLITLLDLSNCQHLTDSNITRLGLFHNLVALNISLTKITPLGIRNLVNTLRVDATGPWPLRIAVLRNCASITDSVFNQLVNFPLLAIIDLRGTKCTPLSSFPFASSTVNEYYHPSTLQDSVNHLHASYPETFSSSNTYFLHISGWDQPRKQVTVASQNGFVVIPSNPQDNITVGNSVSLEIGEQEERGLLQYQRNKDALYQSQDVLESKSLQTALDQVRFTSFSQPRHRAPARHFTTDRPLAESDIHDRSNRGSGLLPPLNTNSKILTRPSSSETASSSRGNATNVAGSSTGLTRTHQNARTINPSGPLVIPAAPNLAQRTQTAAANTFYARHTVVRTVEIPKIAAEGVVKARKFETLSDAQTRHLMLFRAPPPYSALHGAIQREVAVREKLEQENEQKRRHREDVKAGKEKAVLVSNDEKAMNIRKKMVAGLMEMVTSRKSGGAVDDERPLKRRRVSDQLMPSFDHGTEPHAPKFYNKKVNPFRRLSEAPISKTTTGLSQVDSIEEEINDDIEYDNDNVRGSSSRLTKNKSRVDSSLLMTTSKPSDKRLKPISSIPVPILTPEMQQEGWAKEAKALGISVNELKQMGFGWTPQKNTEKTRENVDSSKRGWEATTSRTMESRLSNSDRIMTSGENKRRKSTSSQGFNWSEWGNSKKKK